MLDGSRSGLFVPLAADLPFGETQPGLSPVNLLFDEAQSDRSLPLTLDYPLDGNPTPHQLPDPQK